MSIYDWNEEQDNRFMQILDLVASLDLDYMRALIDNIEIMIENKEEELDDEVE